MKTTVNIFGTQKGLFIAEYRFSADRASRSALCLYDGEAREAAIAADDVRLPTIGKLYAVATRKNVGPNGARSPEGLLFNNSDEYFSAGWPGNSNPSIGRFHGWRGTTNDWSVYAFGVRRCLSVEITGDRSKKVRIVFGRDEKAGEA